MEGILLLLVVGAWLIVLVPMALRRHDTVTSHRSADRFGAAMRVLSRRSAVAARMPLTRPVVAVAPLPTTLARISRRPVSVGPAAAVAGPDPGVPSGRGPARRLAGSRRGPARSALTPAQRRQRTLGGLVLAAMVTLVAGLVGPALWLMVSLLVWALVAAAAVQCHRLAVRRAAPAPARVSPGRVSPVRSPEPATAAPSGSPTSVAAGQVPVPAATEPIPVAGSHRAATAVPASVPVAAVPPVPVQPSSPDSRGSLWSPTGVPRPTYLEAPRAAAARVPEPTHDVTDGGELDGILDRRRAVGDW